ncbi:hypothetical protein [Porphyromonas pogonae]|uniref:hypothetical protein n=1 Tax=Porphyromonas pogonae TaxID=867595 RepID=UPI002E796DD9|nr:hypothetical protein [Porphyromonas pogonae]
MKRFQDNIIFTGLIVLSVVCIFIIASCIKQIPFNKVEDVNSGDIPIPVRVFRTQGNTPSINTDVDKEDEVKSLQVVTDNPFTDKSYYTTEVQSSSAKISINPYVGTRSVVFIANLPQNTTYSLSSLNVDKVPTLENIRPPFVMTQRHSFLALVKNAGAGFHLEDQIPNISPTTLDGIVLERVISRLDLKISSPSPLTSAAQQIRVDKIEVLNIPKYIELTAGSVGTTDYLTDSEISSASESIKKNFIRSLETISYPNAGDNWEYTFDRIYLPQNKAANQDTETKIKITMSKANAPAEKKTYLLSVCERLSTGAWRVGRNRYYKINITVNGWEYLDLSISYLTQPWDNKAISLPPFD